MQKKNSLKQDIHNQETMKILTWNAVRARKTTCQQLTKMYGSNVWVAETSCTSSVLHTKTNALTAVERYWERKTASCRRGCRIFRSLQLRLLSSLGWTIVYLWYIFYFNVDIASLLLSSTVLIYLSRFLNSQDIFKERNLSLHGGNYPCQNAVSLPACPGETPQRQFSFVALYLTDFHFCRYSHTTKYSRNLKYNICEFSAILTIFGLSYSEKKSVASLPELP
jgi:hypothetical protein